MNQLELQQIVLGLHIERTYYHVYHDADNGENYQNVVQYIALSVLLYFVDIEYDCENYYHHCLEYLEEKILQI